MKVLLLRTYTADNDIIYKSLVCIGHEVKSLNYDDLSHERHYVLIDRAKEIAPDVIVFIGAIEQYHNKPVPRADILNKFRDIAPTIHICSDASDYPWWPYLEDYDKNECFDAQISIDGNNECPIAGFKNGLVKLTPTDPSEFKPLPWEKRTVPIGITDGMGHHERANLIAYMTASPDVQWLKNVSYSEMAAFLCRSKISVNHAMNGTGDKFHVKGRVIETAWAGACLMERSNPHTGCWFKAGVEYIEYNDFKDADKKVKWARANESEVRNMASLFHERVTKEHHPRIFWRDVFEIAGVKDEICRLGTA